jgi:hypothetical protein
VQIALLLFRQQQHSTLALASPPQAHQLPLTEHQLHRVATLQHRPNPWQLQCRLQPTCQTSGHQRSCCCRHLLGQQQQAAAVAAAADAKSWC